MKIKLIFILVLMGCARTYYTQNEETSVIGRIPNNVGPTSEVPARREFPISSKVKPCEDFYQYACQEVLSTYQLREDRQSHTFAFNDSYERILNIKKDYLKNLNNKKHNKSTNQLKNYFNACMNIDARKEEEVLEVEKLIEKLEKLDSKEKLLKFLGNNIGTENYSIVSFMPSANTDNPEINDIAIDFNLLSLRQRENYSKDEIYKSFITVLTQFFKTLGHTDAEFRANRLLAFEKELSAIEPTQEEWRVLYTTVVYSSKKDFDKNYPNLHLKKIFKRINKDVKVRVFHAPTYKFINDQLGSMDLDLLKDLVTYNALFPIMDRAYPDVYNARFSFNAKFLGGAPKRQDIFEECTVEVMNRFGKELDFALIDEVFPNFKKENIIKIMESIRNSITNGIEKNSWLSPQGKVGALAKMKALQYQVVRPDNEAEWDFNLIRKYTHLPLKNKKIHSEMIQDKLVKSINNVRNRKIWNMAPLTVNAYYSPADNNYLMPIGILQYPFYDANESNAANFGAVGMVVGHEIGHAVDDMGSQFDGMGRLKRWMTEEDLKNFSERGSKLKSFYVNEGHKGDLTIGENIGDLTGLNFAFDAAFPNGAGSIEDKQKFFLQFARVWCQVMRPDFRSQRLFTDSHAQLPQRVNLPLKHVAGFYEAYQCKAGDYMYEPEDKRVKIW